MPEGEPGEPGRSEEDKEEERWRMAATEFSYTIEMDELCKLNPEEILEKEEVKRRHYKL